MCQPLHGVLVTARRILHRWLMPSKRTRRVGRRRLRLAVEAVKILGGIGLGVGLRFPAPVFLTPVVEAGELAPEFPTMTNS